MDRPNLFYEARDGQMAFRTCSCAFARDPLSPFPFLFSGWEMRLSTYLCCVDLLGEHPRET